MKNKLVMIAAFLAVMVVMTGIAVAYGAIIKSDFYIGGGNVDVSGFTLSGVSGWNNFAVETEKSTVGIMLCTEPALAACSETPTTTSTGWVYAGSYATNPKINVNNPADNPNLKVYTRGTESGYIYVHINQGTSYLADTSIPRGVGHAETSSPANIPEFPTVALPVAAVLGLVFFFHSRKKKED